MVFEFLIIEIVECREWNGDVEAKSAKEDCWVKQKTHGSIKWLESHSSKQSVWFLIGVAFYQKAKPDKFGYKKGTNAPYRRVVIIFPNCLFPILWLGLEVLAFTRCDWVVLQSLKPCMCLNLKYCLFQVLLIVYFVLHQCKVCNLISYFHLTDTASCCSRIFVWFKGPAICACQACRRAISQIVSAWTSSSKGVRFNWQSV